MILAALYDKKLELQLILTIHQALYSACRKMLAKRNLWT